MIWTDAKKRFVIVKDVPVIRIFINALFQHPEIIFRLIHASMKP